MKAICEVSEKRHQTKPGPFLAEIFRVIFRYFYRIRTENPILFLLTVVFHSNSLPVPHPLNYKQHIKYDEANQSTNCVNKYDDCLGSVWDVEFSGQ